MSTSRTYFDVSPQVVKTGVETTVHVRPLHAHAAFCGDTGYNVALHPMEEYDGADLNPCIAFVDGGLRVTAHFGHEQEYAIVVRESGDDKARVVAEFRVYAVDDDLYARRPFKGDFHLHSNGSDGVETPAYVAGASRRIGLDFMAVTDHHKYAPSLAAQDAFRGVDIDLRIYPGEEVHPPDNPVHIINFGGRCSVNRMFDDEGTYREAVADVEAKLGTLPEGVDRYQYASAVWCFDRIREAGGLGVFCHPYWVTRHRYSPSGPLTSHLLETGPFDAFELIGGFPVGDTDSNTLQVARYHEERAAGRVIPIVGASDSHGCERGELFGWFYTIVFSPSADLEDLVESVKGLYAVAVEALPGNPARAHGPFRLVEFALFQMREVFPRHDALCREEGRLMLAHASGDGEAAEQLSGLKGRTARHMDHVWGG